MVFMRWDDQIFQYLIKSINQSTKFSACGFSKSPIKYVYIEVNCFIVHND